MMCVMRSRQSHTREDIAALLAENVAAAVDEPPVRNQSKL